MDALNFTNELNGGKKLKLPRKAKKKVKKLFCRTQLVLSPFMYKMEAAKGGVKDKIIKAMAIRMVKDPDLYLRMMVGKK